MASSNRHWPSMFKSKPCNAHHQWQHHDINSSLISSHGCHKTPYASVAGCEERSPEPKPRWNPKPEQIRILEAIFNSGMVNPPRDEIRKIRAQLQEYGQVGDANVFYWFQNRKSRSKHKLRHLHNSSASKQTPPPPNHIPPITASTTTSPSPITTVHAASSSSSSSSDKSSPKETATPKPFSLSPPPTGPVTYFQAHNDQFLTEPGFFFPVQTGFTFSELANVVPFHEQTQASVGPCTSLLLNEIMNHGVMRKKESEDKIMKMISYSTVTNPTVTQDVPPLSSPVSTVTVSSALSQIQGADESGTMGTVNPARSTVFINDVAFEVSVGPFNVREAFGEAAVLVHSNGQPVLTNEWGVTVQPLHHGSFYYLI